MRVAQRDLVKLKSLTRSLAWLREPEIGNDQVKNPDEADLA